MGTTRKNNTGFMKRTIYEMIKDTTNPENNAFAKNLIVFISYKLFYKYTTINIYNQYKL
jgi:predicted DNA-binding transcriptional regulator AlpA